MYVRQITQLKNKDHRYIPIGNTTCGLFGLSEDYMENYLSLDEHFIKNRPATFFFKAEGESMTPLIYSGDILVVDRAIKVDSNSIVVATLDGERICKRLIMKGKSIILISENKNYKYIKISKDRDFVIFGVVTAIARHLYK